MKQLSSFLRPYRRESVLAPLFKLLEAVFDLLVPVVVARMIDAPEPGGRAVYGDFALLILMAAVGLGCSVLAQLYAARASTGFSASLRQALFDRVQRFSFSQLDALGSDTLITRLTDDVNQVQNGLNLGLRLLMRSPFIVLGAMVMAFTISVRCALIFAVAIPVLFAAVFFIMLVSIPLFGRAQAGLDRVTATTRENLTGVRVIRAFCREEQSVAGFEESSRALTRLNLFVGRVSALLNPLTYVLINIAAVVLIRQAAVQVELGALPQGQVVALYNYMLQITVELVKLASLIITLNKSLACARRTAAVLAVEPEQKYPAAAPEMPAEADAVVFRDVSFTYPGAGAPSLSHISFCAKRGQTVGIIGGTGSGKSTLVDLIPRFYDVTKGRVEVFGRDVREYPEGELLDHIALVPQKAMLFEGTIRDNLRWGNENATDQDLWKALEVAQAKDVVLGREGQLDALVEQGGRNLSGGQKQRLTIARALVKRPDILILDDSASALDFATDLHLRQAIKALEGELTVFIVSQRTSSVRYADTILVLDDGRLVGQGTHDQLLEICPVYQEIFDSQYPGERLKNRQSGKEVG